mgnify:CR=1 FL=1
MSEAILVAQAAADSACCLHCPYNDGKCQAEGCNLPDEE